MTNVQANCTPQAANSRTLAWPQRLQAAAYEIIRWHDRVAERRHLRGLDDHMLSDIGLTRSDVDWESSKPFWRA